MTLKKSKGNEFKRIAMIGPEKEVITFRGPIPDAESLELYFQMPYNNQDLEGLEVSAREVEMASRVIQQSLENLRKSNKTIGRVLYDHWSALEAGNCAISSKSMMVMCKTYVEAIKSLDLDKKLAEQVSDYQR